MLHFYCEGQNYHFSFDMKGKKGQYQTRGFVDAVSVSRQFSLFSRLTLWNITAAVDKTYDSAFLDRIFFSFCFVSCHFLKIDMSCLKWTYWRSVFNIEVICFLQGTKLLKIQSLIVWNWNDNSNMPNLTKKYYPFRTGGPTLIIEKLLLLKRVQK